MSGQYITVQTDLDNAETELRLSSHFRQLPALLQADILQDLIDQAETAYNDASSRIISELDADITNGS
ncbi:MAG: hypothetical protein CMM61_03375 [Rhodospirillaceae bacterium]|nr:hypothetical protein [Rhodospirillaceae bacterium]